MCQSFVTGDFHSSYAVVSPSTFLPKHTWHNGYSFLHEALHDPATLELRPNCFADAGEVIVQVRSFDLCCCAVFYLVWFGLAAQDTRHMTLRVIMHQALFIVQPLTVFTAPAMLAILPREQEGGISRSVRDHCFSQATACITHC
jgi:hypothetical protein